MRENIISAVVETHKYRDDEVGYESITIMKAGRRYKIKAESCLCDCWIKIEECKDEKEALE